MPDSVMLQNLIKIYIHSQLRENLICDQVEILNNVIEVLSELEC